MTLNETHHPMADKRELAWGALTAIENHLKEHGFKLGHGSDDPIHEALWDALGYVEVDPA